MRFMALCGVATPLLFAAGLVAATAMRPGYSQVRQTISQLSVHGAPHASIMIATLVLTGCMTAIMAYGLHHSLGKTHWIGPALVAVYGLGVALAGLFRDDADILPYAASASGRVHDSVVAMAFIAMTAGTAVMAWRFAANPQWRVLAGFSLACSIIGGALIAVFGMEWWYSARGLIQRGFVFTYLLWVEVVSLRLLWLAR